MSDRETVRVSYLELRQAPAPPRARAGPERVGREPLGPAAYLALYRAVGGPVRWDQRLRMPAGELSALLGSARLAIYMLRRGAAPLGFCEFDRGDFPDVELKNFGLVPEAQGQGLGPWLLASALEAEWRERPRRIWLHTDTWDHPAAIPVYRRAGFTVYAVRDESPGPL